MEMLSLRKLSEKGEDLPCAKPYKEKTGNGYSQKFHSQVTRLEVSTQQHIFFYGFKMITEMTYLFTMYVQYLFICLYLFTIYVHSS